ncbi:Protein CBG11672 [Caenorhabditis briggsae]|uniref:Serpentine receptor class r-10 n=1 Tax=Caenorhabditis briggsae TaxID=6238 RepID=A8XDS1_CAEBR|nr:Protein CBG11672 [Caenorhabditis briggsae]CAP30791.2 Protein CBG11672 [Caenorhabditis briggsae]
MNTESYRLVKLAIQVISVIASLLINSLLITLIITKSPKNMGNYRHLMVYFCCCSMIFGILDVIVQPNILTYKSAFFMVVDMKRRNFAPWFGKFAVYALCGSFGIAIYGIAIHFVYRSFALERQGRIRYFKGAFLIFWFSIPLVGGAAWFLVTAYVFPKTKMETEYIRSIVNETFNMDIDNCAYNAGVFFPLDENGKQVIGWWSFAGFAGYLTIMIIPFSIILSFGFKSWRIVGGLLEQGDSEFAKNLQLQLYKALVAQTIIPVILLFIPFGLLFTLPIFEIDCQFLAALIFAIYPAVDPLPILYFVDYYRIPVIDFFKTTKCRANRVGMDSIGSTVIE